LEDPSTNNIAYLSQLINVEKLVTNIIDNPDLLSQITDITSLFAYLINPVDASGNVDPSANNLLLSVLKIEALTEQLGIANLLQLLDYDKLALDLADNYPPEQLVGESIIQLVAYLIQTQPMIIVYLLKFIDPVKIVAFIQAPDNDILISDILDVAKVIQLVNSWSHTIQQVGRYSNTDGEPTEQQQPVGSSARPEPTEGVVIDQCTDIVQLVRQGVVETVHSDA